MADDGHLIAMLTSPRATVRYDACELIRLAPAISPETVAALENALHDPDHGVAERAEAALRSHRTIPGPSHAAATDAAGLGASPSHAWAIVTWILFPGLCLLAWSFLSFMFWQGGSSNLAPIDGLPDIGSYAPLIASCGFTSLAVGAVSGALLYQGLVALVRRTAPMTLPVRVMAIILGAFLILAYLLFVFYAFGMLATG